MLEKATDYLAYQRAKQHPEHERRDLCSVQNHPLSREVQKLISEGQHESPDFTQARGMFEGARLIGGGRILKKVPGMGTVYDWRGTNWSRPNGGRITLAAFVQHIPVVPNMAGIADFVRLRDVLVAQGLMVQNATDSMGNVALYTEMNMLCYQARGANQVSCGTEHMHMTTSEDWSKRQLRASAWLVNQAIEKHSLPAHRGVLAPGAGLVRVTKRGQTSHMEVSNKAGFHDRVDPGNKYDWEYVYRCVTVYRERIRNGTADTKGFEGI